MYRLATNRTDKNQSKKSRTWVSWDTESRVCTGLLRIT